MNKTHVSEGAAKTPGQATHTPEPWNYVKDEDDDHLIMAGDQVVIRSNGDFSWDDGLRKDMTRAAVCVNALEGIANPAAVKQLVEAANYVLARLNSLESKLSVLSQGGELMICRQSQSKILGALAALDTAVPKE